MLIHHSLQGSANSSLPVKKKSVQVSIGPYDPRKHCLFYGQEIVKGTHGHDSGAFEVKTDCFPQTILQHCRERSDQ